MPNPVAGEFAAAPMAVTRHGLRTRRALLEAGREIAAADGLAGITVSAVASRAGVAKGTFYVHFADRETYVNALREAFNSRVSTAVAEAVGELPAGAKRLVTGITAYLDVCLEDRSIKALLREAQTASPEPAVAGPSQRLFVATIESNLRAMGWREAAAGARLVLAMTAEVALIEHETGDKNPGARRALRRLIHGADQR